MFKSQLSYFTLLSMILSCPAEKLIIDTDAGADDALAILMLLRAEALNESPYEVVAITCTYGNTKEENVEKNVILTLDVINRTDIPVYGGAKKPLLPSDFHTESVYGSDGFGDSSSLKEQLKKITDKEIESIHAAVAMVELSKLHKGNISVVVLGPTTNVALAASLDENFVGRVKSLHVMGSSVAGVGNYKANVEYNFGADPEANMILLSSTNSSQLTLYPWETVLHSRLSKFWRINVLGKKISPYINFINDIEQVSFKFFNEVYTTADSLTIATILWPRIVKSSIETLVNAVTDGAARGSILVEYPRFVNVATKSPNARIIQSVDVELFKEALIYYLTCERVAC